MYCTASSATYIWYVYTNHFVPLLLYVNEIEKTPGHRSKCLVLFCSSFHIYTHLITLNIHFIYIGGIYSQSQSLNITSTTTRKEESPIHCPHCETGNGKNINRISDNIRFEIVRKQLVVTKDHSTKLQQQVPQFPVTSSDH